MDQCGPIWIQDFLLPEKDEEDHVEEEKKSNLANKDVGIGDTAIEESENVADPVVVLEHVSAKWDFKVKGDSTIKDLSLKVSEKELLTVVGSLGSGNVMGSH